MKKILERLRKGYGLRRENIFFLKEYIPKQNRQTLKLLKSKGNLIYRSCPLCGLEKSSLFLKAPVYEFVECANCDMVYADNILNPQIDLERCREGVVDEYWELAYEQYKKTNSRSAYARTVRKILKYAKARNNLLDIGCSFGAFLNGAKGHFKNCEGLEVNRKTAEFAKKSGFKIYTEPIEDLKIERPYDVVVMNHLLDQICDLDVTMFNVKRILKKGGVLFISCPNINSLSFKLFGRCHIHAYDGFHVNLFTRKTLARLLRKHNFQLEELKTDDTLDIAPADLLSFCFNRRNFLHRANYLRPYSVSYLAERLTQKFISSINLLSLSKRGVILEALARNR